VPRPFPPEKLSITGNDLPRISNPTMSKIVSPNCYFLQYRLPTLAVWRMGSVGWRA